MEIRVSTAEETRKLAIDLATEVLSSKREAACIIFLKGDLGSGKTTFTQGLAQGLNAHHKVKSPTFVLMREYSFNWPDGKDGILYHLDCYRLNNQAQMDALAIDEILKDQNNIVVIEWPEKTFENKPGGIIEVSFRHGDKEGERIININKDGK